MSLSRTGPRILATKGQRPIRTGTALNLPRSPSMAFDIFIEPFETPRNGQRTFRRPVRQPRRRLRGSAAQESLALFNTQDFRIGSKSGRNLRSIFNVKGNEFDFGGSRF